MAELWFPVPPLAGDVVLLRPCAEADAPGIVLAFSDPVMQRFSWRTAPYTETDARDYFAEQEEARLRGEGLDFALVEPRDQDVVLGGVSLYEVRLDRGCAAVGYWLTPGARGRGLATNAVRLLARWAFAELGLARLGRADLHHQQVGRARRPGVQPEDLRPRAVATAIIRPGCRIGLS